MGMGKGYVSGTLDDFNAHGIVAVGDSLYIKSESGEIWRCDFDGNNPVLVSQNDIVANAADDVFRIMNEEPKCRRRWWEFWL